MQHRDQGDLATLASLGEFHLDQGSTHVTRDRVIAPPDRFIFGVQDEELIAYFTDVFGSELAPALPVLHQLIEGICNADFTTLRRRLQGDYEYFGAAAEARSDAVKPKPAEELEEQELRFLQDFMQLMQASQYRMLTKAEWEAAQAEDFLFTLPCDVKWSAMDNKLLPRYWAEHPSQRGCLPDQMADRILVFQRGADVAVMQGTYFMLKINLLISMWLLQPLYNLFVALMSMLGIRRFVPQAPKGLASTAEQDPAAQAALKRAEAADRHPASTSIERRTFARVFPDGQSVLKKLVKKVKLQEACFRDVVILYRQAVPDSPAPASEFDVIKEADPKFMQRNIQLHQFRGIPLADLEMIMPEKKIFVPPKVFVEMAVNIVGGLVAVLATLWHAGQAASKEATEDGSSLNAVYTAVSLLGGRAAQIYSSALYQKMAIEHAMGKLLYERTAASGEAVLTSLVDSMCRQRVREILICYCMLLNSQKPMTAEELDVACEHFLAAQFGCRIDFYCEEALPALERWGLMSESADGKLSAVPMPEALRKLDDVWDAIHDFKGSARSIMQKAAAAAPRPAGPGLGPTPLPVGSSSSSSASTSPTAQAQGHVAAAAGGRPGPVAGAALGRSLSQPRGSVGGSSKKTGVRGMFHKVGKVFTGSH